MGLLGFAIPSLEFLRGWWERSWQGSVNVQNGKSCTDLSRFLFFLLDSESRSAHVSVVTTETFEFTSLTSFYGALLETRIENGTRVGTAPLYVLSPLPASHASVSGCGVPKCHCIPPSFPWLHAAETSTSFIEICIVHVPQPFPS